MIKTVCLALIDIDLSPSLHVSYAIMSHNAMSQHHQSMCAETWSLQKDLHWIWGKITPCHV